MFQIMKLKFLSKIFAHTITMKNYQNSMKKNNQ